MYYLCAQQNNPPAGKVMNQKLVSLYRENPGQAHLLLLMLAIFAAFYFLPLGSARRHWRLMVNWWCRVRWRRQPNWKNCCIRPAEPNDG